MTDYAKLEKQVAAAADLIWDMASNVWEFAELGYKEFKSSAYECEALDKNGFTIFSIRNGALPLNMHTLTHGSTIVLPVELC